MSEEKDDNCPVCMEKYNDKCSLPCNHFFCKNCIIQVVQIQQGDLCPYCRSSFHYTDIQVVETGAKLLDKLNLKILNSVYIQGDTEGLAAYHFESATDCYISYSSPHCSLWPPLDNGERPPSKKPFVNIQIDEANRVFQGDVHWAPTSWQGDVCWEYKMHFSEDYNCIQSGSCVAYDSIDKTNSTQTHLFPSDLSYERLKKHDFENLV